MVELKFRFDQRLLIELGRQLVSKDEVAVSELVKNSYDADASIVEIRIDEDRISIADNGTGMNWDTIENAWLVVGTTWKKRNSKSPIKQRRVLGEKGIGRLSAFRLGNAIEIRTKSADDKLINLKMKLPMDELNVTPSEDEGSSGPLKVEFLTEDDTLSFPGESNTGTIIGISDLRGKWDQSKVSALRAILSRLLHPFDASISGFSIVFFHMGKPIDLEPDPRLKNPHYSISVLVNGKGEYSGSVSYLDEKSIHIETKITGVIELKDSMSNQKVRYPSVLEGGCGPISLKLYAWDRDREDFRGLRGTLDDFSGFSLMRDGILAVKPKTDWLGLNIRRVQNPTMRLSTNQIVGAIYIKSDINQNLIDKTDREGLIENEAFEYLKQTVYILMSRLEEIRYRVRRSQRLSKGSALFDILDTQELREVSKGLPDEAKQSVLNIADEMDRKRSDLEELILGRDRMATAGVIAAEFIHSGRNALVPIVDGYRYIEKHMNEVPDELKRMIDSMVEGGKQLAKLFDRMMPYMRFRVRNQTTVLLSDVIDMLRELYEIKLKESNIKLIVDLEPQLSFVANQTDILIMLTNFLVNSIYWAPRGSNPDGVPKIRISARSNEASIIIEFQDSGPGVNEEDTDQIFELGFSLKEPTGTGIGLAVNNDIVNRYGGKIELQRTSETGGAKFTVTLPKMREEHAA
ncbi:MAG: ATP-binding protein [Candidatus Thermoplasmatota archaeon]|nr:ATP-binding protein [Candidatus Thermoplasmatota archaeon]